MKVKVFYNKSCKICKSEIDHYKRHCDNKISWIDMIKNEEAQILTSKTNRELLRRIHVIKDGKVKFFFSKDTAPTILETPSIKNSLFLIMQMRA